MHVLLLSFCVQFEVFSFFAMYFESDEVIIVIIISCVLGSKSVSKFGTVSGASPSKIFWIIVTSRFDRPI